MFPRVLSLTMVLALALHGGAFAVDGGSIQGGVLSGFLKKNGSPYQISETVVVPEGKALVVEAGTVLEFAEGVGLDVRGGSLAVIGESNNPVVFKAKGNLWNGVSVTGTKVSDIQDLRIENAEYGLAVEKGSVELRSVTIDGAEKIGLFARNAQVDAQWISVIRSKNAGVWAAQGAKIEIASSKFEENRIAAIAADGSQMRFQSSGIRNNDVGILLSGDNAFFQRGLVVEQNRVAIASAERPGNDVLSAVKANDHKRSRKVDELMLSLGEEPENPYANGMASTLEESSLASWKVSGSVDLELGYHAVFTNHNHYLREIFGEDTVRRGEKFVNHFQVPGFFANWVANVVMESEDGKTIEVSTDISGDRWNKFNVHSFQAAYTDQIQRFAVGNIYASAGDLYLAGVNALGASYELSLFQNAAKEPLFELLTFGGETQAPKIVGERDRDFYNEYIDDGEALAQGMIFGSKVRWNMHRRFNGSLGFVGSKDYLENPFLRDGMSPDANTINPLVTSRTFFADGNWLVYPGDIKLNGQVAVGAADTANSAAIHAVNKVFADAGLDASNFSLLNRLMKNPSLVRSLSAEQLESIFGDNSMMTASEMKAELQELLVKAQAEAKNHKGHEDTRPSHANFWDYKNWAVSGSYEWSNDNTFIEGYFRYVGAGFFSAGSPDLLQNTRKYGGNLKQKIFDFWKLNFGYEVNVENAAGAGNDYNIFGLGEGEKWGLLGADDSWLRKHEQDENRTLYVHDAYLGNEFKILENLSLFVKYAVNYRTRNTAQRLYANYSAGSGIYSDSWFSARKGQATLDLVYEGDTMKVDSARWMKYYRLADEDFLATQFEENLLKHTVELAVTYKFSKNVLKVGGTWVYRTDLSEFQQDDLLKGIDFSNETYGILGYYFHGGDYFEQRYPVSLTTTLDDIRNTFAFMPRYKIYNRDDMTEFEWNLSDDLSFPLSKDFMEMTLSGSLRQNFLNRTYKGENQDEMELDVNGSATLRVHHTSSLYTDWTLGAVYNYRPDNRADQYKDFYIIANLNYSF